MKDIDRVINEIEELRHITMDDKNHILSIIKNFIPHGDRKTEIKIDKILSGKRYLDKSARDEICDVLKKLPTINTTNTKIKHAPVNKKEKIIYKNISNDDIEKELDNSVDDYKKFDSHNPMENVEFHKKTNEYIVIENSEKIKFTDRVDACNYAKNMFIDNDERIQIGLSTKNVIRCHGRKIMMYNNIDDPLFDMMHIAKVMELDEDEIYDEYFKHSKYYGFFRNEYDGYVVRNFISEDDMYKIILSANNSTSKLLRDDICKILKDIRISGHAAIDGGKFTYTKDNINDKKIKETISQFMIHDDDENTFSNPRFYEYVKKLVNDGSAINIGSYNDQNIMYLCITTMKDQENKHRLFCKIGYSTDICNRIKSLKSDYGCDFYLIGIKYVKNEKTEKEFHSNMKEIHPELSMNITISKKSKEEIYILNKIIVNEFMSIKEKIPNDIEPVNIDTDAANLVKNQSNTFAKYMNHQMINYESDMTDAIIKMNDMTLQQKDVLIKYLDNNHALKMAQIAAESKATELEIEKIKLERMKLEMSLQKK